MDLYCAGARNKARIGGNNNHPTHTRLLEFWRADASPPSNCKSCVYEIDQDAFGVLLAVIQANFDMLLPSEVALFVMAQQNTDRAAVVLLDPKCRPARAVFESNGC